MTALRVLTESADGESEQERTAGGRRAVFEVSELTIELSFVVSRSRQGQGGIDLKVVSVGGQADRGDERTQRMTLRLVAAGRAGGASGDEEFSRLDLVRTYVHELAHTARPSGARSATTRGCCGPSSTTTSSAC